MTYHDKNKELTYLKYLNVNSLFEWEIPQNFLVNGFKWVENTSQFYKNFMKSYNEDSDEGYFPEVDVQYPKKLYDLFNNLLFLPERMKIEKIEKLLAQLHDKKECFIHIRNLKQTLNHGLVLKKVHRVIKFN